ncbi:arsenic resistance N-acetyltransferase ArsN2 [Flavihumibacter rivuli]|uniref:arsenic resistance N-acetyltransferase ArsN2 n=1 Tax=Flavihumibacter rivuli TaxID=2838156 RepID=UPI001BDF01BB|nr:arsenic resistance N-acetyltransferase ArsN2 [Flavihumibacter rivuli]ULQ55690.1 arsenic resistance N-acetyltransferase ArsN2 [Flavihumibacter rivuli]
MENIKIRPAVAEDLGQLVKLLEAQPLPTEDINPALPHFFVSELDNRIIGAIGLECYGPSGLLRSMVVDAEFRKNGIAGKLVSQLEEYARTMGVEQLYLITNTAETYFSAKGFVKVDRSVVAEPVLGSREFNGLCPASAVIMTKAIA